MVPKTLLPILTFNIAITFKLNKLNLNNMEYLIGQPRYVSQIRNDFEMTNVDIHIHLTEK